jgi:uncharacterized protein YjbJ (UPF0337 family)
MDKDRDLELEGMGNQIKGKAREVWGRLTGHESDVVRGKAEQFGGKAEEHLGRAKNELDRSVDEHTDRL